MKKWVVVVNRKYLVSVEAETNAGAEHKVMDFIIGIGTALAFDPVIESKYYDWAFSECETISFEELCNKSNIQEAKKREHMNDLLNQKSYDEEEVKRLEERLTTAREVLEESTKAVKQFGRKHNIYECWTAKEEIEAMRLSTEPNNPRRMKC